MLSKGQGFLIVTKCGFLVAAAVNTRPALYEVVEAGSAKRDGIILQYKTRHGSEVISFSKSRSQMEVEDIFGA